MKISVKIMELLRENQEMTLTKIAESIGKTARAVEMADFKLVKQRTYALVGPQNGGHWEILK